MKSVLLSAALGLALISSCHKDDDGDSNSGVSVPAPDRVIPGNFHNDRDEAGFKAKLPQTTTVLQNSTNSLSLNTPGGTANGNTKKINLTRGAIVNFARTLGIPHGTQHGLLKASSSKLFGESNSPSDTDVEGDVGESQGMYDDATNLKEGEDCTALLSQLSSQYDQSLKSYSDGVKEIADTDFASKEGFTVDSSRDPAKEAFAYKFYFENEGDTQDGSKGNVAGRFAGGANDNAVALTANGVLTFSSKDASGNIGMDLNTYADIPSKELALGVGFGLDVASTDEDGKTQSGKGSFTVKTVLLGGATPSQTLQLKGNFASGQESSKGELNIALSRVSDAQMILDINAASDDKTFKEKVTMAISKEFNYETCKVSKVEN